MAGTLRIPVYYLTVLSCAVTVFHILTDARGTPMDVGRGRTGNVRTALAAIKAV